MVDIDTHRVIDLIASREVEDVSKWLKSYPNLEVVSRDGSISYKSAIEQAGRHIQQISDRFHLLASQYDGTPMGNYWDKPVKEDLPAAEHNANVTKKMKVVEQVRKLREQGFNKVEIAGIVGIDRRTVTKYLKKDFNPSSTWYQTTVPSKIKPYASDIKKMLSEGRTFKQISSAIREKGYSGSDSTIRMFATRERRLMKEAATQGTGGEKIERKWLVSLLYHPIDEVSPISTEQLERIIGEYPMIGKIYDAVASFKQILFGKKETELDRWIEETKKLEIEELTSFINGLKRDIDAEKNYVWSQQL